MIAGLVKSHGGIEMIYTHRYADFDRRTGALSRRGWANTVICRDGWSRRVTLDEGRELASLPEGLKARRHVVEGQE